MQLSRDRALSRPMRWASPRALSSWVIFGLLLSFLIGVLVVRYVQIGYYAGTFVLSVLMLSIMGFWLWQRSRSGQFDWFEPINLFFVSMAFGFGFRGIYISFGLYDRYTTFVSEDEFIVYITLGVLYGVVAVVAYMIGYARSEGAQKLARRLPIFKPEFRVGRLYAVVIPLSVLGVASLIILLQASGFSLSSLSLEEISRKRHYLDTGHYLKSVPFLLTTAVTLLGVVNYGRRPTVWFWILLPLACIWPLYSSTRGSLLGLILLPLILRSYLVKPLSTRTVLAVAAVFAVILSAMFALRGAKWRGTESVASSLTIAGVLDNTVGSRSFADLVTFAHVIRAVPSQVPLQLGRTYSDLIFGPIPRSWWPNKPVPIGKEVGLIFYEQEGAVPPSMAAEAYLNFHLPGLIMAFLAFGFVSRVLYEFLLTNRQNLLVVGAYAFLVIFVFKFANSDFVINMGQLVTRSAPLLVGAFFVSRGLVRRGGTAADVGARPSPVAAWQR